MNRKSLLMTTLAFVLLALAATSLALAQVAPAASSTAAESIPAIELGDDDNPTGSPQVVIPERYRPQSARRADAVQAATDVYFTPQDQSTSVTLLFLYNTTSVTATVDLEAFDLDGSTVLATSINVPGRHLVRVSSDAIKDVGGSWVDPVIANFTTRSTYVRMALPSGVKAEAYVAWNGGPEYDPLAAVPTLSLRFSTDPATVFLPAVERN